MNLCIDVCVSLCRVQACACMCISGICVCTSGCMCASLCFSSNAARGSLQLMGPPVASLLIFLHPSPFGGVLGARPGPRPCPRHLSGSHPALMPLLPALRLLVVFRCLSTQQTQVLLASRGTLTPRLRFRSGLEPGLALRRPCLLLLVVSSFGT